MANKPSTGDAVLDAKLDEYDTALQVACARALTGDLTKRELIAELSRLSTQYIAMFYVLGGGDITSAKGQAFLKRQKVIHTRSARRLANDVFSGRYKAGDDA